jgi:hypothetical protein
MISELGQHRISRQFDVPLDLVAVLGALEMEDGVSALESPSTNVYTSLDDRTDQDILQVMKQNGKGDYTLLAGVEQYGSVLVVTQVKQFDSEKRAKVTGPIDVDGRFLSVQSNIFVVPDFEGNEDTLKDITFPPSGPHYIHQKFYSGLGDEARTKYFVSISYRFSEDHQDYLTTLELLLPPKLGVPLAAAANVTRKVCDLGCLLAEDGLQESVGRNLQTVEDLTTDSESFYETVTDYIVRFSLKKKTDYRFQPSDFAQYAQWQLTLVQNFSRQLARRMSDAQQHLGVPYSEKRICLVGTGISSEGQFVIKKAEQYIASLHDKANNQTVNSASFQK